MSEEIEKTSAMKWPCISKNEILFFTIFEPVLVAGFGSAEDPSMSQYSERLNLLTPLPRNDLSQT